MSILAAFILAAGACVAAGFLCVPLHRLSEVLSELELRSAAPTIGISDPDPESPSARSVAQSLYWLSKGREGGSAR